MNLDCTNSTSLFELGFGLSAVLAAVARSKAEAREQFMNAIIESVIKRRPQLPRRSLETDTFQDLVIAGYPNLKLLFGASILVRLVAATVLVASAGTLLQGSYWGNLCKIEPTALNLYVGFAFVLGPFAYWAYQAFLRHVIRSFIANDLPEQCADLLAPMAAQMKVSDDFQSAVTSLVEKAKAMSEAAEKEAAEVQRAFAEAMERKKRGEA